MQSIIELPGKQIVLKRNEFLLSANRTDTNIYFIESGSLKISIRDQDEEQIIRLGYQSNLLVALDSFLTHQPSAFYIQAIKKTTLKIITKEALTTFLNTDSEHQVLWNKILEDLVLQQMEREIDLLTTSPKERYLRVLKRSPRLFQEIPGKYIANYLRMSAETLSRLQKS